MYVSNVCQWLFFENYGWLFSCHGYSRYSGVHTERHAVLHYVFKTQDAVQWSENKVFFVLFSFFPLRAEKCGARVKDDSLV